MNTSNKKNKSGSYKIANKSKVSSSDGVATARGRATTVRAETQSYTRMRTNAIQSTDHGRTISAHKRSYVHRNISTGRFEDLTVSYDTKGIPEGYIIQFEEYEDLRDRLDALEAHERIKQSGGIPHEVVKLELSGLSPLAAWRKYRGLTQRSLAESAGITQPYIAAIESGKKDGKASTLKHLAEVLDTTIDNLIE